MTVRKTQHAQAAHHTSKPKHTAHAQKKAPAFGKKDVQKMTDYLDNNGFDDLGGKNVKFSQLKGDAKHDFKEFQKNMGDDYPSVATLTKLENRNVLVVHESNDGGDYFGIYNPANGKRLASGSEGESGSPNWGIDVK